jgi:hypothetical protein
MTQAKDDPATIQVGQTHSAAQSPPTGQGQQRSGREDFFAFIAMGGEPLQSHTPVL